MILTRRGTQIAAAFAAAAALTACGASATETGDSPLVSTTGIWADITSNVGCGAEVAAVIPDGADHHAYEASLRDREMLESADVVVVNGAGLEEGISDLLGTVSESTEMVDMSTHIDLLATTDNDDHHDDEHDDDGDHDDDPHVWLDPIRVANALPAIASALEASDPERAGLCTDSYTTELQGVDEQITQLLADIPADDRVLVTNHDSLAYFADRYNFEVVGTVINSSSTIAEANPADLAKLADTIADHGVHAIFTDLTESDADAAALADRLGILVVPLSFGSLTPDSPASTYAGMLVHNAGLIAEALAAP